MKYFLNNFIIPVLILSGFMVWAQETRATKIPNFWIRNLEGVRFDTRKRGGPYVISFFYVNCIPCIKEIPQLYTLIIEEFPHVELLFVNPVDEDSREKIRRFAEKLEVPVRHFYRDNFGSVSNKFFDGQYTFPTILGVSKRKQLFRHSRLDEQTKQDFRNKLN